MMQGLIHIYCGNGKGKTSACLGLALRCAGNGGRVLFVQFLKSWKTGELESLKNLPNIGVLRAKTINKFSFQMTEKEKSSVLAEHKALFAQILARLENESVDLLILDEIIGACNTDLFELNDLLEFLKKKPVATEIAMSGRDPAPVLLELADYVSEVKKVKHPFDRGIAARKGIER
ncbi:MAG: cob(I)yrinic acid a,c-diamide adenosyltransferase [Acholeplasmataceae bacterium]|nr:cob(I)yrinic acid a,c-diamide adenosyltransferase [Acholeplasmataceae bacterium]